MTNSQSQNTTFEAKVGNLIAATQHLEIPQVLLLRRLTIADPESRRWATARQLDVIFNVIIGKAIERIGLEQLREARQQNFVSLIPPGPDGREEDVRVLTRLATDLLGNPIALSEHEEALAKLLKMGPAASRAPTPRQQAPFKEPPPLFTAQLIPESDRAAQAVQQQPKPRPASDAPMEDGPEVYVDFADLFDDTICAAVRKTLALLQVKGAVRKGRPLFIMAPEFGACYEDVLRRHVLPQMRSSRHIQQLALTYNWNEVGGDKLIEILQSGEVNNPLLHHWDHRWSAFRTAQAKPAGKGGKSEDDPWPLFREDAVRGGYEPPTATHLPILQDIIRYETEAFAKAWREISQLYEQEFSPSARQSQAREGAFRDGLLKWSSKLHDHVGEFLIMKTYFMFARIDEDFIRRMLSNFGRSDADRRRHAPLLYNFVQSLEG